MRECKRVLSRSVSEPECSGSSPGAGKGDLSLEDVEGRERGVFVNVAVELEEERGDLSGVFEDPGTGDPRDPFDIFSKTMRFRSVRLLTR